MTKKDEIKGYVVYEGASMINGAPIVGIVTIESKNIKTGNIANLWILHAEIKPNEAVKSGDDSAVCGDCPLRDFNGGAMSKQSEKRKINELKKFFEEKEFNVHLIEQDGNQCAEIETWTDGGVNMIIWLNPFTVEEFEESVNNFDMYEQIDLHRQEQNYKNAFTIKDSVEDFEKYHNRLKTVLSELKQL